MSRLEIPGPPNCKLFLLLQNFVLFLILTTIFILFQWKVGGLLGYVIAIVVGLIVWNIYAAIMYRVMLFWFFRRKGQPIDGEVVVIADYAFETQDWHGAARQLEELILLKGESVQRLMSLGSMKSECGEYRDALSKYDKALTMTTDEFEWALRSGQAEALRRMGQAGEAYDIIQAILDAGWKMPPIYCIGCEALTDLGRFEEAQSFLKMADDFPHTSHVNKRLSKPTVQQAKRDLKEAREHLERAKEQSTLAFSRGE